MINIKKAKRYCCEEISLIENYNRAIADQKKTWDIHHRKECDENGKTLFTCKQLAEMNLYYNRPASELVFVTRSTHCKIHREHRAKNYKALGKKTGAINGKKNSIPIIQFSLDGTLIREWPSLSEAGRQLGIHQQNIGQCCKGRLKHAGGFVWRYKDRLQ